VRRQQAGAAAHLVFDVPHECKSFTEEGRGRENVRAPSEVADGDDSLVVMGMLDRGYLPRQALGL